MATAGELKALRDRTGALLLSPACQKVDFYWGGNHITGGGFAFVALATASRPQGRHGISFVVRPQRAHVGASYDPASNTVSFPTVSFGASDPWEKQSIVHEMTHAMIDEMSHGKHTRAVDDELCAFVAAGLFNIYSAANPHLGPFPYAAPAGSIFATAHGVAMSVQGNAGYAISPTVAHPLRQAILASPTYTFLHAHPSHSYSNNGLSL